jgi:methylenetetrahydrofolate dehydrogenase (NADP+)/methenyltetrahydrofolate cyclohydrolase
MEMLLLNQDCSVTIVHSKSQNIENLTRNADIIVIACGKPKLLKSNWVKEGAVIIDVGINRTEDGLCGDADFDNLKDKVAYITPVPGGVGPMTVAMLLDNTYEAFCRQKKHCNCQCNHKNCKCH